MHAENVIYIYQVSLPHFAILTYTRHFIIIQNHKKSKHHRLWRRKSEMFMKCVPSYGIVLISKWHFVILRRLLRHFFDWTSSEQRIRCDIKWNYLWHMNIWEHFLSCDGEERNLFDNWSGSIWWNIKCEMLASMDGNSIIYAQTISIAQHCREFNKCCYTFWDGKESPVALTSLPWWTTRVEELLLLSFPWIFVPETGDIVYVVLLDILSWYHHHNFPILPSSRAFRYRWHYYWIFSLFQFRFPPASRPLED